MAFFDFGGSGGFPFGGGFSGKYTYQCVQSHFGDGRFYVLNFATALG